MAYRELGMVEVREIVRRWLARDSIRAIARATGMDRKTIAEYVRAAVAVGVEREGPPLTDAQVTAIVGAQRPGRPTNMTVPVRRSRPSGPTNRRSASGWGRDCA